MVTLAIVSFGLLGIAGIIANSLKSNQSSYARTQATILAYDIIERMRANRATAETAPSPYQPPLASGAPNNESVPVNDLSEWRRALATVLPEGKGSVSVNDSTKKVTVVVQWTQRRMDRGNPATSEEMQHVTIETRL
ncbi:MAG: type IV pilus modification protein PilV [Oxalobacter sp.]|nr:MAG: type IV pilus modification protein PilV [Oxalobacter sp.]